jgi:AcrR family transcriptional regulator
MVENKKGESETPTKQKILDVAIDLFAQHGYDAVSMQDIAQTVGIKKASLYYHFTGKDQILKEILQYPITRISVVAPRGETEQLITSLGVEGFMSLSSKTVINWLSDERMQKIWRILCIELYHNDEIKKFFSVFQGMSMSFWESNFSLMLKHKLIKPFDPKVLAAEYLSFFMEALMTHFLYSYGSTQASLIEEYKDAFNEHTKFIVNSIKLDKDVQA